MENITAAIKEGLNNTNLLESREKLGELPPKKRLEQSFFSKFIQQQKNLHGSYKQIKKKK